MKVSKDKLKQRVLENIKATKRKRQIQAAIEEILANPDQEILDEKSKRGRAQRKKARAQAKKEKAKAAKSEQAKGEEAPAADAPAGDAPAGDAPAGDAPAGDAPAAPEGEKPKAGGPSVGGLKAFAAGMMKDPKKAMNQLGKDTKQYLKDNPEVAKELTAAMEAGNNAKVEDLLGGLPGQDALIDAGDKILSGDVEGLEGVGAAAGAALAGGYGVEAAQLLGGAAGMALNNFADVTKNAETLAGTIIPQLSTLSKFLLDSDAADLKKVGAELKGLNKMFDEKLGFLMKASAKKAKEGGEQPTGGAAAAADVPPELTDEQKADMSPEEIKAYEEKRQEAIQAVQRGTPGAAAGGAAAGAAAGGAAAGASGGGITTTAKEQETLKFLGIQGDISTMSFKDQDKVLKKARSKENTVQKQEAKKIVEKIRTKNKIDQTYLAIMNTEKSAFGKTKSAKIGAPLEYYFKKFLPYLRARQVKEIGDKSISTISDFNRYIIGGNVVGTAIRGVRGGSSEGATTNPDSFFEPKGPNSINSLNPAEIEEFEHFVDRLFAGKGGKDAKKADELTQAWEMYGMGSKIKAEWAKNAKIAKEAPSDNTGLGSMMGRAPQSIYRKNKAGEVTGLTADAIRAIKGEIPEGYTPPKGFDASKFQGLLNFGKAPGEAAAKPAEGGGEAAAKPAAKQEPKK